MMNFLITVLLFYINNQNQQKKGKKFYSENNRGDFAFS